jgi:hypothetical protein
VSLSRDSLLEREVKAIERAKFALKQRLERIRWEHNCLIPLISSMKDGKSVYGLPEGSVFDIEIVTSEDPDPPKE